MSTVALALWCVLAVPGKSIGAEPSPAVDFAAPAGNAVLNEIAQAPAIRPVLAAPAVTIAVKPHRTAEPRPVVTVTQKREWLAFTVLQHGAATFDAWSTRRSIVSGKGKELDPLMRPFAGSPAIYGAIQLAPAAADFWSRRLLQSNHPTLRKLWWLPQVAGTVGLTFSGVNNLRVAGR